MFGKYTFSYDPSLECGDPGVSMSFSGEADLPEILDHFGSFLRATGHPLDFDQEIKVSSPGNDYEEYSPLKVSVDDIVDSFQRSIKKLAHTLKELGQDAK